MKKILIVLLFCFPFAVRAIDTSATSAILMDQDSGRILYAKDIHNTRSVASISKIMTALIAVESGKLKDKVTIGDEIKKAYGSGIYIKAGEELTLEDLVYGLMLRSGNDAALAIAKYVGGSVEHFVDMMNDKARELKMEDSTFHNPHGLDEEDGNFSSAYDMAILMSTAMKNEEFAKIVGTKKYKLKTNMNTYIWYNKNKLLNQYQYTTGGKTGFTKIARRTLVTTASKQNLNLVAVTLNDGNDFEDHMNLFDYGFKQYQNQIILKKGVIKIEEDTYYKNHTLYINHNISYPLSSDEENTLHVKYCLEKNKTIKEDTIIGTVETYLGDKKVHEESIYAKPIVQKKISFFTKFKKWIRNLW